MSMRFPGPGLFSDIGKKAKDLLTKDFYGMTHTTVVKKGGLCSLDVSMYENKNRFMHFKVDTEPEISTTLTVLDTLRSTKFITVFKLPCYLEGKSEQQHFHENAIFAFSYETNPFPLLEFSGTVGGQGVAFGAEVGYDTYFREFTKYGPGFGVAKAEYHAALILADKGDTIKVSCLFHFNENQTATVAAELTRKLSTNENTLLVASTQLTIGLL